MVTGVRGRLQPAGLVVVAAALAAGGAATRTHVGLLDATAIVAAVVAAAAIVLGRLVPAQPALVGAVAAYAGWTLVHDREWAPLALACALVPAAFARSRDDVDLVLAGLAFGLGATLVLHPSGAEWLAAGVAALGPLAVGWRNPARKRAYAVVALTAVALVALSGVAEVRDSAGGLAGLGAVRLALLGVVVAASLVSARHSRGLLVAFAAAGAALVDAHRLSPAFWLLPGLAFAVAAIRRDYDRAVTPVSTDAAASLAAELEAVRAAQERLDRRRAALDERERAVAARERELRVRAAALEGAARPALEPPPPEPEPEPLPPEPEPEPPPSEPEPPVPEPVAPPTAPRVLEPAPGQWSVEGLARLVERRAPDFPDRADEWHYYVVFLREQADLDGVLPPSFDALVTEVFADLIERPPA